MPKLRTKILHPWLGVTVWKSLEQVRCMGVVSGECADLLGYCTTDWQALSPPPINHNLTHIDPGPGREGGESMGRKTTETSVDSWGCGA